MKNTSQVLLVGTILSSSLFTLPVLPAGAQAAVDIAAFADRESWPLLSPGDVSLRPAGLPAQRSRYDFVARDPRDLDAEPEETEMIIELRPVKFPAGNDAYLLQWTSGGSSSGAAALDLMFLDRQTFQVLFKIASRAPGDFAGVYEVRRFGPDRTTSALIGDDGAVDAVDSETTAPRFDFASMGHLLALMDLDEHRRFRLVNVGVRAELEPRTVALRVADRRTMADAAGVEHRVRPVELLSATGGALVTFYVLDEPPFFFGWDYVLVERGTLINRVRYRGAA